MPGLVETGGTRERWSVTVHDVPSVLQPLAAKVPEVAAMFWMLKLLTTGMGEAMSDAMGQKSVPIAAVVGIFGMWFAIWLQLRQREYRALYYWFAVMMVAVFGTMAADGIHDGANIPYTVTTPAFALITGLILWRWHRTEGTLSIHSVDTRRREKFYWAAVLATFALGTAAGDLTAYQLNLGFWPSAILFAVVFAVPAVGWWRFNWNPILSFWFAYIVTRPLGASFADWLQQARLRSPGSGRGTDRQRDRARGVRGARGVRRRDQERHPGDPDRAARSAHPGAPPGRQHRRPARSG